jgi:hypothetical protein
VLVMSIFSTIEHEILILLQNQENWSSANQIDTIFQCHANLGRIDEIITSMPKKSAASKGAKKAAHADLLMSSLQKWVTSRNRMQDVKWRFISSDNSQWGSGVFATRDISKGEVVMQIKRESMLSARFPPGRPTSMNSLLSQLVDNPVLELVACVIYHSLQGGEVLELYSLYSLRLAMLLNRFESFL